MKVSNPQPAASTALKRLMEGMCASLGWALAGGTLDAILYQHEAHVIGPLLPGLRLDVRSTHPWRGPPSL